MKDEVKELFDIAVKRWDSWRPDMSPEEAMLGENTKENELGYKIFSEMGDEELDEFIQEFIKAIKPETKDNFITAWLKYSYSLCKKLKD